MRFIRSEMSWEILRPGQRPVCLENLSLRCGYRAGEICNTLACSERYLYEVFTRDIGLPPKTWLRWERIVVARRKLTGGLSPATVATHLGFVSLSNFRREFVAFHGIAPREYQVRVWGLAPAIRMGSVRREAPRGMATTP